MAQKAVSFDGAAIVTVKRKDCRINFWFRARNKKKL